MPVVTVSFKKLSIERTGAARPKNMKVNNNIAINDIEKTDLNLGTLKQPALRFAFDYTTKYSPNYASINMAGDLIFFTAPEKVESILKEWKKDKKTPEDITLQVINHLYSRCTVQALVLSQELNLPPPVRLPQATKNK